MEYIGRVENARKLHIKEIKIVGLEYALNYYVDVAYIVYNRFSMEICRQLKE